MFNEAAGLGEQVPWTEVRCRNRQTSCNEKLAA
jgi:hypothetical protein